MSSTNNDKPSVEQTTTTTPTTTTENTNNTNTSSTTSPPTETNEKNNNSVNNAANFNPTLVGVTLNDDSNTTTTTTTAATTNSSLSSNDTESESETKASVTPEQVMALLKSLGLTEDKQDGTSNTAATAASNRKKKVCPHQASIGTDEPCITCQTEAMNEAKQHYQELKTQFGTQDDRVLSAALELFSHLIQAYRLTECDELLSEVAQACRKYGNESQVYVQHIQALAFLRFKQFRFREACELFEEMLSILGPSANLLENMGHAYNSCGQYKRAEQCFTQSLQLINDRGNESSSNKGGVLLGLGVVKNHQGDYVNALPILLEAKQWYQQRYTGDHSLVAKAGSSVGAAFEALGRSAEAEKEFRECVRIFRVTCGDDSPLTAGALVKLGNLLHSVNKVEEAESVLWEALQRNAHVDQYSISLSTIAELQLRVSELFSRTQGRRKAMANKVIQLCEMVENKLKSRSGSDNSNNSNNSNNSHSGVPENGDSAVFYKQWAEECFLINDLSRASQYFNESLRILRTIPGPESASLQGTCSLWLKVIQNPSGIAELLSSMK